MMVALVMLAVFGLGGTVAVLWAMTHHPRTSGSSERSTS